MTVHPLRVLVVDDHPSVRASLGLALQLEPDLELCALAESGEEGVALALELHPDVVVMDVTLPEMDGLTAVATLRDRGETAAVVVLSARQDPCVIARAHALGVHDYVLKTEGLDCLLDSVRSAGAAARC